MNGAGSGTLFTIGFAIHLSRRRKRILRFRILFGLGSSGLQKIGHFVVR